MIPPVSVIVAIQITGVACQKHNAKFYVPVATLSINENIKFLENITQGFKRTISPNKYRAEITTKIKKQ